MPVWISYTWRFLKPFKLRLFFFFLLACGITVTTLTEPYVYKLTINSIVYDSEINFSLIMKYLLFWAAVSFSGMIFFSVLRYWADMTYLTMNNHFWTYAFERMMLLDVKKHLSKRSGELVKKVDSGAWSMFDIMFQLTLTMMPSLLAFVAVLFMIFSINWKVALVSVSLVPVYVIVFIWGGVKTSGKQRESVKNYERVVGRAYDAVANIFVVKSFVSEKNEYFTFKELLLKSLNLQKKISFWWAGIASMQFILSIINKFLIFAFGVYFVKEGSFTVGDLILFLSVSGLIYAPVLNLGSMMRHLQKFSAEIHRAHDYLEEKIEVEDLPDAKNINLRKAEISFENVEFNFQTGKKLFKNLNFTIPENKITAIVGHSGGGKSTLVSLMNRFYDVCDGAIKINGRDIRQFTLRSLRKNIGMVLQDNTMFNNSIFDNIKYGDFNATKKEVIMASKKARIHEFIMSLPENYAAKVGERGLKLSGGERQRVAIARAILKDPPILILDEATSALDSETEKLIQTALSAVMKGRTTIIIAHRLSTVRKADNILVFDKGKLVEQGTHDELIAKKGAYKKMVDLQVSGFFE